MVDYIRVQSVNLFVFNPSGFSLSVQASVLLAIDSIPNPDRIGRDLGVWDTAPDLPSVFPRPSAVTCSVGLPCLKSAAARYFLLRPQVSCLAQRPSCA